MIVHFIPDVKSRSIFFGLVLFSAVGLQSAVSYDTQPSPGGIGEEAIDSHLLGQKLGLFATEDEIEARRKLMAKLGEPEHDDTGRIRKQIISEKAFKQYSVVFPEANELNRGFEQLVTDNPGSQISFEEAFPLLENRALIDKRANRLRALEKMRALGVETRKPKSGSGSQDTESGIQENGQIQVYHRSELELGVDPGECLIMTRSGDTCLYTVKNFNWDCAHFQPPKTLPLDSARWQVLDRGLNILIFSRQANKLGLGRDKEIEKVVDFRLGHESKLEAEKSRALVLNDSVLKKFYLENIRMYTIPDSAFVRFAGSTDSALVFGLFSSLKVKIAQVKFDSLGRKSKRNLPDSIWNEWDFSLIEYSRLPIELAKVCDTLGFQSFSEVKKTPYGFFILFLESFKPGRTRSFESAKAELAGLYLRGSDPNRSLASNENRKARLNATSNMLRGKTVRLWLVPRKMNSPMSKGKLGRNFGIDTSKIHPVELPFGSVPLPIISSLESACRENKLTLPQEGISHLGRFHLAAKGDVGVLECKSQFPRLRNRVVKARDEAGKIPETEWKRNMLRNEIMAMNYWHSLLENSPMPTDEEVKRAISDNRLEKDVANNPMLLERIQAELKDSHWKADLESLKSGYWVQDIRGR